MSWCWRRSPLLLLPAFVALPARAQSLREAQVWGVGALSRPAFYGAGFGLDWRDDQRDRIAPAVALGSFGDGKLGFRADLAYHFLVDPAKAAGSAAYGGGGLSVVVRRGRVVPYVLLVLGVEGAPGGGGGTFVEIGVGGGARVAIGYRWRKHNAPGR
ncbi:MAG TPA: hypothetical protein VMF70_08440 [Gemmatimonadales bacterium]|nr:hypothetical protein [Gemmatimonadales bacterium]